MGAGSAGSTRPDEDVAGVRVVMTEMYMEAKWELVLVESDKDVAAERVVRIVGYGVS